MSFRLNEFSNKVERLVFCAGVILHVRDILGSGCLTCVGVALRSWECASTEETADYKNQQESSFQL